MKVDPAELVGLARRSEETAADLRQRWAGAAPGREVPREAWGDHPSAAHVSATYDEAALAAGSALSALVAALELGARALVDAADDVTAADESSAELLRVPGERGMRGGRGDHGRGEVLMPAHPWQLRCDTTPLTAAAALWLELAEGMTAAADDLVRASRRVRDHGWESGSAEVYDGHRKQVVGGLDTVAVAAREISRVLDDIAGTLVDDAAAARPRVVGRRGRPAHHAGHPGRAGLPRGLRRPAGAGAAGHPHRPVDPDRARHHPGGTVGSVAGGARRAPEGGRLRRRRLHRQRGHRRDRRRSPSGSAPRWRRTSRPPCARAPSSNVAGGLDAGAAYAGPLGTTSVTAPSLSGPSSGIDGCPRRWGARGPRPARAPGPPGRAGEPRDVPGDDDRAGWPGGSAGESTGGRRGAGRAGPAPGPCARVRPGRATTEPTRTDTDRPSGTPAGPGRSRRQVDAGPPPGSSRRSAGRRGPRGGPRVSGRTGPGEATG